MLPSVDDRDDVSRGVGRHADDPEPWTGTMMGVVGNGATGVTVTYRPDARSLTKRRAAVVRFRIGDRVGGRAAPAGDGRSRRRERHALREVAVLVECDALEPAEQGGDGPEREVVDRSAAGDGWSA